MTREILKKHKRFYSYGLILQVVGGCFFCIPFIVMPLRLLFGMDGDTMIPIVGLIAFIGFGMIVAGGIMRNSASEDITRAELELNPRKKHQNSDFWSHMADEMNKDASDEADTDQFDDVSAIDRVIVIKCRECEELNEEESELCQECGNPV